MKKKLLVTLLSTALVSCCVTAVLTATAETETDGTVTETKPVITLDHDEVPYLASFTGSGVKTMGANAAADARALHLQDGESLIMNFTVVSSTLSSAGSNTGFMLASADEIPSPYPYAGGGRFMLFSNANSNPMTSTELDTSVVNVQSDATRGQLFANGNEVKVVYTPYQSETELGSLQVLYRVAGSNAEYSNAITAQGLSKAQSPRNRSIFLITYGEFDMTIKDYSIETSFGANLLTVETPRTEIKDNGGNGKYTYSYGYGFASAASGATATVTPQYATVAHNVTYSGTGQITTSTGANLTAGEQAVLEFDVDEATIGIPSSGTTQFGITVENNNYGNASSYLSTGGMYMYSRNGWGEFLFTGDGTFGQTTGTKSYSAPNMMKAGNSVKIVYKPYYSAEDLGFVNVYYKSATETEYTLRAWATGLNENAFANNVFIKLRATISTTAFTLSNYRYYVETIADGSQETVFDATNGGVTFSAVGATVTEKWIAYDVTLNALNEKTVTFNNYAGTKNYAVYVENGEKLTLPTSVYGTEQSLLYWNVNGVTVKGGTEITVNEDLSATPVGLTIAQNVAGDVRTQDGVYGLRFGTTLNYADMAKLEALGATVETGTIIAPATYLEKDFDFTIEGLETAGKKYMNVVNDGWFNRPTAETDGYYQFYGAITAIKANNIVRDFAAVGYAKITLGEETYVVYTKVGVNSAYKAAKVAITTETEQAIIDRITELYITPVDGENA